MTYEYDSWGNVISIGGLPSDRTLGELNPFRYRGYYYDSESGFYYVSSRFYDPEIGRFVSADDADVLNIEADSLIHYNLYAYCWNNPINMMDYDGYMPWFAAAAITGAIVDTGIYLVGSLISGNKVTWAGVGKAALSGAISGLVSGAIGKGIKAANNAIRTQKTIKYTTGTANQIGQMGEKIAKIKKNKTKYLINGRFRIPDGITKKYLQEVKNVKKLSLTLQLKDSMQLAKRLNKRMVLYIRRDTYLSKPLQNAIKQYNVKIKYLW